MGPPLASYGRMGSRRTDANSARLLCAAPPLIDRRSSPCVWAALRAAHGIPQPPLPAALPPPAVPPPLLLRARVVPGCDAITQGRRAVAHARYEPRKWAQTSPIGTPALAQAMLLYH